jgi:GT2 family glycosyltransferase
VIADVGLMDEKYFVYIDDVDRMYRAKKCNKSLYYTAKSTLYHKVSSLTGGGSSPFAIKMCGRNTIYFLRKHAKNKVHRTFLVSQYLATYSTRYSLRILRKLITGQITLKQLMLTIKSLKSGLNY